MVTTQDALAVLSNPTTSSHASSLADALIIVKLIKALADEGFTIEEGKLVPISTQNESISS